MLVAAGILLSRLSGLVRQRVFAHYLGLGDAADALAAAFRIPNLLQNLLGEGALSASFIPVYARLRAEGRTAEATRVAHAVLALLALVTSLAVLLGVLGAPLLVDLLAPGFEGLKRDLAIQLVRVLFPGIGILVISAWCLGILNSHGRFFLSYAAPVAWNLTIIGAALLTAPGRPGFALAIIIAWAAVLGSLLQVVVQLPAVRSVLKPERGAGPATEAATVVRNFGPAVLSRGVVQISAWVDMLVASLLGTGAVTALASAQMISLLPVSLFGMSVSAAELPAMSREQAGPGRDEALRARLEAGLRRIAYYVVPAAAAFVGVGHVVAGVVFETGAFTARDSAYVWIILAGAAVGLLATTGARLVASAFFALGDTRTPLRYAAVRMGIGVGVGLLLALWLPGRLGLAPTIGVAGLTLAGGIAGWVEFGLLRRALARRLGPVRFGPRYLAGLWLAAAVAVGAAWGVMAAGAMRLGPLWGGLIALGAFGGAYLVATWAGRVPEARQLAGGGRRRA